MRQGHARLALPFVALFLPATASLAQADSAVADAGTRSVAPSSLPFPFDSLRPGHRVRVIMSPTVTMRRNGTVVGVEMDSLLFRGERDKELLRLPRSRLQAMEISAGPGRSWRRAFAGAAAGTVAGFGLAKVLQWADDRGGGVACRGRGVFGCRKNLNAGLAIGAGVGFTVGRLTTGERWRRVAIR